MLLSFLAIEAPLVCGIGESIRISHFAKRSLEATSGLLSATRTGHAIHGLRLFVSRFHEVAFLPALDQ